MTFNAAHKYLGLTTEVLRTEKAINDIACHPLPPSFYAGGGLRHLRQRFDGGPSDSENESDYFSFGSRNSSRISLSRNPSDPETVIHLTDSPASFRHRPRTSFKGTSSRQTVQAGDLHSSAVHSSDTFRPRTRGSFYTPKSATLELADDIHGIRAPQGDDFDLRDAVMSCIAKSIGLLQPPLSGGESVEASPAFPPSDAGDRSNTFRSSFGSLSLLELADDASSSVTASSSSVTNDGYMSGLDNEVEILFFPAGSILAKAGETNSGKKILLFGQTISKTSAGLFYVIEGFLDILLPSDAKEDPNARAFAQRPHPKPRPTDSTSHSRQPTETPQDHNSRKPLFTVKPGGIAGYLGAAIHRTALNVHSITFAQRLFVTRHPMLISKPRLTHTWGSSQRMLWSVYWRNDQSFF